MSVYKHLKFKEAPINKNPLQKFDFITLLAWEPSVAQEVIVSPTNYPCFAVN